MTRLSDEQLGGHLAGLDVLVLAYRWSTHSGFVEACADLGTTVLAPRTGHLAEQHADEDELTDAIAGAFIAVALHEVGRKGTELKRFKGLGEMNPEELWETTMNPSSRSLLKVTWDSAAEADRIFTILMGEHVESRRAYIEDHALEVRNLDI